MPADATPRSSLRVAKVAELLDLEQSQVRRLLATGQLDGHRIGKRGVRIFQDSIVRYQEAQEIIPAARILAERRERQHRPSAAHLKAVENLKRLGLL